MMRGLPTWAGLVLPSLAYCWVVTQAEAITFCVKTRQVTKGAARDCLQEIKSFV